MVNFQNKQRKGMSFFLQNPTLPEPKKESTTQRRQLPDKSNSRAFHNYMVQICAWWVHYSWKSEIKVSYKHLQVPITALGVVRLLHHFPKYFHSEELYFVKQKWLVGSSTQQNISLYCSSLHLLVNHCSFLFFTQKRDKSSLKSESSKGKFLLSSWCGPPL